MLDIDYTTEFDAVIKFGYFDKDGENFGTLENFYNALKPSGKFLMHTDVIVSRLLDCSYKYDKDLTLSSGNKLHQNDTYDPITKLMNGILRIIQPDGTSREMDYSVRLYTKEGFVDLCFKAGFRKVEC